MPAYLPALTWALAISGGGLALGAVLGKATGFMGPVWANRLTGASYAVMGLSMALFLVRGLGG
ncbi:MAG: hypothetical protein KJ720_13335 [Proteobacteria bacterium]|nr:hypothetical protein [Pseudomonadota bacterium]MBU1449872.1 hypothetical protein [Pseudomonadota bacterium]